MQIAALSDMFTGRLKDEIPLVLEALGEALLDKVFYRSSFYKASLFQLTS